MALKPFTERPKEPDYIRVVLMYRGQIKDTFHANQQCDSREDLDTLLQIIGKAIAAQTGSAVRWVPGMGGRFRLPKNKAWGPPTVGRTRE